MKKRYTEPNARIERLSGADILTGSGDVTPRDGFTLPIIWGVDGIWISIVAAEALALCLDIVFLITNRKKYHY